MLAVVPRFKWRHIDYVEALGLHFELTVAYGESRANGALEHALGKGMQGVRIEQLERAVAEVRPDYVHVMYYHHEEQTLLVRDLVGEDVPLVFECRDPITTLMRAEPGDRWFELERAALHASDRHIFVSRALRDYLARAHETDLSGALIVPQAYPAATVGPPAPKLSARDGRTHLALVGTAEDRPGNSRWYVDTIRALVGQGLVVHSHFHDLSEFGLSLEPYERLGAELADYHPHPAIPYGHGHKLSDAISRYDLMGVFHELDAPGHNEAATLAVCLPTKAVCGWLHGGIPVVCFRHYGGVVERIERLGIGFVVDDLDGVAGVAADRAAIEAATERCLGCRHEFTTEHVAGRVSEFLG
jgi:hypothetical protein